MRAVNRLIGVAYGLAGAGYAASLRPAPLALVVAVGLLAALHGLIAYAFLTLKPWGRWPVTGVNLLYVLFLIAFSAVKPTAIGAILVAILLGLTWWSWQPGFPAAAPRLRGSTGARGVLNTAFLATAVVLFAFGGFELQRHLRRCAQEFALDGGGGCLTPLVFREDTEYASGYSAPAFQQLRLGMTEQEVLALLGSPLDRWPRMESGEVGWQWTRSPGSNSYRVRSVVFRSGRVVEIFHEFYID